MNKSKSGFTIVELLIVIVVIGILATITVVAYTGVQNKARNAQLLSAIDAYEKGIRMYMADHNNQVPGAFVANQMNYSCLGVSYPAISDFTEGSCYNVGTNTSWSSAAQQQQLNSDLKQYIGTLPDVSKHSFRFEQDGSLMAQRGLYYAALNNGVSSSASITYWINDSQTCGRGTQTTIDVGGGRRVTVCSLNISSTD